MDNRFLGNTAPRVAGRREPTGGGIAGASNAFGSMVNRTVAGLSGFGAPPSFANSSPRVTSTIPGSQPRSGLSSWGQRQSPFMSSSLQQAGGRAQRNDFSRLAAAYAPRQLGSQMGAGMFGGNGNAVGVAGSTGTMADDANAELSAASAKYGVPVNFLKTILIRESSGNWDRDGNRLWWGRPSSGPLLPYVGIFENTWQSWGCAGTAQGALGNKAAQIDCMAKGSRLLYDRAKNANPGHDWRNVFSMYFSGRWEPIGWRDENGLSDTDYVNNAMRDMQRFDAMAGGGGYTTPGAAMGGGLGTQGMASSGMSTIWGGSGERNLSYGFNAPNNLGLYGYGSSYGMDGRGHTGIDIPGRLNEPAYTPVGGTVVCARSGQGPGAGGSGCSAFSDVMGSGAGRIEVQLDNGHTVIFGHMSTSNVRVGQRVRPGDQIGGFGGMNGVHIHLEYRIPDPSTPSGWRIVDPAQYLGGAGVGPNAGQMFGDEMGGQQMMNQLAYNPDVPFAGWQGRSLSQNRASRTPNISSMISRYR